MSNVLNLFKKVAFKVICRFQTETIWQRTRAEGQRTRKARGRPSEGEGGRDKAGQMPKTGSVPDIAFPIGEEGRVSKDQTPSFHIWSRWHLGGF